MRAKEILEAYLDDYNTIRFYFNKMSYGGISSTFYLKHPNGKSELLKVKSVKECDHYFIYTLEVENIVIGENYVVEHEFARRTPLKYGLITKTKRFDEQFKYTKDDLGATFNDNITTFKVFSPTSYRIELVLENKVYEMEKDGGIFKVSINEYLHNVAYKYRVYQSGTIVETIDPYCIKTTNNSTHSIAYDTKTLTKDQFKTLNHYSDAIIYEASIADFTAQFEENPSTYVSFYKPQCINYLKQLGVTHIQLLPVTSCGSTDDNNPQLFYNWGYDIIHFQALTNRYAIQDSVQEFKKLVETYHQHQIGINLDMVFNHVHELDTSPLNILVPNYYFQVNDEGYFSNATYCGNDYDSTMFMSRKLVVDSCLSWVNHFQVDGFRFDLMGILDVDTMNEVYRQCSKINPNIIIYGEGWHMPSLLEESKRASIPNHPQMPHIAHFNDYFRDVMKGKGNERGYLTYAPFFGDLAKTAFLCQNYYSPENSINYVECHDNQTVYDYVMNVCYENPEIKLARLKLLMAAVILSYGIPFIHSGQEYGRSKKGKHNTYRDNSGVNHFNWNLIHHPLVAFTKRLIEIRKNYPELRLNTKEEIEKQVSIDYIYEDILMISVGKLIIVFNPTYFETTYAIIGKSLIDQVNITQLKVKPYSVYVVEKL